MPFLTSRILTYISIASPLPAIWIGKKEKQQLWWYAIVAVVSDIMAQLFKVYHIEMGLQGNVFILIELIFITAYYKNVFYNKWTALLVSALVGLFFVIHTLFLRSYNVAVPLNRFRFNLNAASVIYLWYIMLAIIGFYKLITGPLMDNILKSRRFWVNVAFLIYASGVFFMFMFAEQIRTQDIKLGALLWSTVFCSLNITKNMLLAKALSVNDGAVEP